MKIQKIQKITDLKHNHKGVYLLFGEDRDLIYIGQSINMRARINTHISDKSKRQSECNDNENYYNTKIPRGKVFYYSVLFIEDDNLRNHIEISLIFMLKPTLNDIVRIQENKAKRLN